MNEVSEYIVTGDTFYGLYSGRYIIYEKFMSKMSPPNSLTQS